MSRSRSSAFARAEDAQLQQALEASQAQASLSTFDQQQQQLLPPLPPTISTPFQTLHGTLDNTTTSGGAADTSRSLGLSSSSDQILPSSVNPLALPPLPLKSSRSTNHSSIENPDTSLSKSAATTDEIRNSFSTSNQSSNLKQANMSSEIENSTNSGGLPSKEGVTVEGEEEQIPDSDNEGSNSGQFSLFSSRTPL